MINSRAIGRAIVARAVLRNGPEALRQQWKTASATSALRKSYKCDALSDVEEIGEVEARIRGECPRGCCSIAASWSETRGDVGL